MHKDTYIIIPVYNESAAIKSVIETVLKKFTNIVCVNDGSKDETAAQIAKTKAKLINHTINLGQGAALQTGIEYALLDKNIMYFVTFDADGQHSIDDVERMLDYIKNYKVDIVLGSRFLGEAKNISKVKKWLLKLAIKFSNWTTGLKLSDAHNGLRVFNRHFAENVNITMPDMAHASEITHRIAEMKFKYAELPVTITYTDYSKAKGQSILNAVNITFDLIMNRFTKK